MGIGICSPYLIKNSQLEDRWITIGKNPYKQIILVVVHTSRDERNNRVIRIISARKATMPEVKQYEERKK